MLGKLSNTPHYSSTFCIYVSKLMSTMNDSTARARLLNPALSAAEQIDPDPQETAEWREAFEALIATQGPARARQILDDLSRSARTQRIGWQPELCTPYVNTIAVDEQPVFRSEERRVGKEC